MSNNPEDQAREYRKLVLAYETTGTRIDELLRRNGGHTRNMSTADMRIYRQLATQRDMLFNQIKALEENWLQDENGG